MQNLIFLHVHIKTESFFFFLANEISRLFFSDLFNNSVFPDIIVDPNLKQKLCQFKSGENCVMKHI